MNLLMNHAATSLLFGLLLIIIIILSLTILFSRNLFNCILYCSLISSFCCFIYLLLAAPDVALTEASIGVVLSTLLPLLVLRNLKYKIKKQKFPAIITTVSICFFIGIIINKSQYLPEFGANNTIAKQHMADYYIQNTSKEIAIPNLVAAILASYRGFDTLGETLVIMIAGLCVYLILSKEKLEE